MQTYDPRNTKATRVANAAAAGQTDVEGAQIDMANYQSVEFLALIGTITAGGTVTVKAQGRATSGGSWADLAGAAVALADDDDNQVVRLSIVKPRQRYVRCVVERAAENSVVDGILALQHGHRCPPVDDDATTVQRVVVISPAESN